MNSIQSFVCLAPTNLTALIVDGSPIHKLSCLAKSYERLKKMNLKYIFVDEVSMLQKKIFTNFL